MVQMWYMEAYPCGDPRLPHHMFPPKPITPDELTRKTGTQAFKCDMMDPVSWGKRVAIMKIERKFNGEDTYILDGANTVEFEEKIEELFEETENKEDQARMILEGAAYYDVEDCDGRWVRILCEYGDLIVIPAGKNIRFTTTPKNFVKMRRFFKTNS
uniref:Uncharacterized protein n=1 Tax=Plectus sambesii TaxID=2011161 RepID=A0A914VH14_9BILA